MSTQSQIDANRANAQKSSGPVTPEGREASSHNRGTHFLSHDAEFRVLPKESERDFHILFMEILTQFNPRNSQEMFLIKRMSEYEWMRRRAVRLQDDVIADTTYMRTKQFALFLRYESQNFRAYNTCREQLLKLRSEQTKSQIGPNGKASVSNNSNGKNSVLYRLKKPVRSTSNAKSCAPCVAQPTIRRLSKPLGRSKRGIKPPERPRTFVARQTPHDKCVLGTSCVFI
jgi:hypothetical protein